MSKAHLSCAVIGAGQWMRSALLPALRLQPRVKIAACVAGSLAEAESLRHAEKIDRAYASIADLLAAERRIDLAVIATPDHVHAEAVSAFLSAQVSVYCEKPLANDARSAHQLVVLGDKTDAKATVGYSFRFNPAIQALKRDVAQGRLGDIWLIELAEHNPQFHPQSGKPMNWKGDPKQAGAGALFEYGSHVIDLAAWLCGPIARVSSSLQRIRADARLDDIATLQMEFLSGARGLLVSSWVLSGGFPGIRIRLHGAKGLGEVWVDDRIPGGQRYRLSPPLGAIGDDQPLTAMKELRSDAARRHLGDFLTLLRAEPPEHGDTLPTLGQAAHVQDVLEAALAATTAWQSVEPPWQKAKTPEETSHDQHQKRTSL
jgi:predicted dehydrogenase